MHCLVIDDQTIFLDLLASLVESFPEIAKVSKAESLQTALAISGQQKLDLAIVDLVLPDGEGVALATSLVEQHPQIELIILSGCAQEFICPRNLIQSIRGVIDKADAFEALRDCLTNIIQPVHQTLTPRQKEIYKLIGKGKSNKEIAQHLGTSITTVETHRKAIAKHMQLSGAELIRAAALNQQLLNTEP
jgi:DNA-binding NarL/FixJ family response regulator